MIIKSKPNALIFSVYNQFNLKGPSMSAFSPLIGNNPSLLRRISLAYGLYLTRACSLLCSPTEVNGSLQLKKHLTDRDITFLHRLVVDYLGDTGQQSQVYAHADMMAWTLDRGIFVKGKS